MELQFSLISHLVLFSKLEVFFLRCCSRAKVDICNANTLPTILFIFSLLRFQMHADPFEDIKMAEENAEQHRRSANEKEVRIMCLISYISILTLTLFF